MYVLSVEHTYVEKTRESQKSKHKPVALPVRSCGEWQAKDDSREKSDAPHTLVLLDVWGLANHASMKGLQYVVTFIDDYSRYVWLFFTEKTEVLDMFKDFEAEAERETGQKEACLRSVNGGE
ncbi:hypothetical protein E3N88_45064 [Mikania micrantha]|uniref:Integrase catalytic domain-containing protein n=1 Tax=Mikania micrantha TaxID=192012 RepID=A0A5N6LAF6_9ASTR|nr:hypothetical protein E3N88_45064 [Mikania micrantha]